MAERTRESAGAAARATRGIRCAASRREAVSRPAAHEVDLPARRRGFLRHERFGEGLSRATPGDCRDHGSANRHRTALHGRHPQVDAAHGQVQGIETVYIPEPDRGTLCISSQVGCAMDCTFCATAQQGFNRNLSVGGNRRPGLVGAARTGASKRHGGRRGRSRSPTLCSWAWASRSPTTAMWCRPCGFSWTIWATICRGDGSL